MLSQWVRAKINLHSYRDTGLAQRQMGGGVGEVGVETLTHHQDSPPAGDVCLGGSPSSALQSWPQATWGGESLFLLAKAMERVL